VLVAGPALLLAGVILMMTSAWTLSHLVFLAGTLVMLPTGAALHDLLRDTTPAWVRRLGLALTVAGALTLAGQFLIDLVVMHLAAGERELAGELFDQIQASTAFALTLYIVGPALLFAGLVVSGAALVRSGGWGRLPGWMLVVSPLLVGAGRLAESSPAEVAGGVLILAALALTARSANAGHPARTPHQVTSSAR
jgi:hypothetical protein